MTPFILPELAAGRLDDLWLRGGYPDGGILAPGMFPDWDRPAAPDRRHGRRQPARPGLPHSTPHREPEPAGHRPRGLVAAAAGVAPPGPMTDAVQEPGDV